MPKKLIVVLDSNELIFGLSGNKQYPKILIMQTIIKADVLISENRHFLKR